jgi:hypothetical protein
MAPDRYAAAVVTLYVTFQRQITGAWLSARDTGASLRTMQQLRNEGAAATRSLIESVAALGQRDPTLLAPHIALAATEAWLAELGAIAVHNVADLVSELGGGPALSSVLTAPARAFTALLRQRASAPRFMARDSAGRNWQADKLVRFLARRYAYDAMISAQAAAIALEGVPAEVVYADPLHRYYGTVLSPDGSDPALPSLAALRETVFHPNATAELRAHRVPR